MTFMENKIS